VLVRGYVFGYIGRRKIDTAEANNIKITGSAAAAGFAAAAAQFLLTRELMVVSQGYELNVGFVFFAWLAWVGIGSAAGGVFVGRRRPGANTVGALLLALGALLPLSVLWARVQGRLFGYAHGELIPVEHVLVMSLLALAPVCLLSGFLFPVLCRAATPEASETSAAAARVYAWDTLGSAIGGIVLSVVLAGRIGSVGCAAAAATIVAFIGIVWLSRPIRLVAWFALVIGIAASPVWLGAGSVATRTLAWGRPVRESVESGYGNITVLRDGDQHSFFTNGRHAGEVPDTVFGEYMAHTPLLAHPAPKRVFMMGAGPVQIAEALKHRVARVTWAELDPRLIELKEEYTPRDLKRVYTDPHVRIVARDPRRYLAQTKEKYDVIVIDAGAPETIAMNRYFTKEFFNLLRTRLAHGGVAAVTLPFTENYMGAAETTMFGTIFRSAVKETMDPQHDSSYLTFKPQFVPGLKPMLLLGSGIDSLGFTKPEDAAGRFRRRGIHSAHYSAAAAAYYFDPARRREAFAQFSPDKTAYFSHAEKGDVEWSGINSLLKNPDTVINSDFSPTAAFSHIQYAASYYGTSSIARFLAGIRKNKPHKNVDLRQEDENRWRRFKTSAFVFVSLMILLFSAGRLGRRSHGARKANAFILIAIAGAAGMAAQLVLIFVFQVLFGVVYQYLGALNAMFLGGAALGAAAASNRVAENKSGRFALVNSILLLCFVIFILIIPSVALSALSTGTLNSARMISAAFFWAMALFTGGAVGAVFPHALNYLRGGESASAGAPAAGLIYFADLAGACFASLAASALLIPLLGIVKTLFAALLAVMLAAAAAAGGVGAKNRPKQK